MNSTTITIAGNVATDPVRRMAGDVPYTRFRLACSERRRDKDSGGWVDTEPSWYTVSVFRTLGENAARSLQKGERVLISGRLRIRAWETAQNHGTDAEIEADAIGHDLRWGTSRFEKTARADAAPAAPGEAAWATPGADAPGTQVATGATSWPLVSVPEDVESEAAVEHVPF